MTCMRAPSSSKLGLIRPPELAALEHLKKILIDLKWENVVLQLFLHCSYWILFILECNNDIHESLDEFEKLPDLTTDHRVSCPLGSKKSMFLLFLVCYLSVPF